MAARWTEHAERRLKELEHLSAAQAAIKLNLEFDLDVTRNGVISKRNSRSFTGQPRKRYPPKPKPEPVARKELAPMRVDFRREEPKTRNQLLEELRRAVENTAALPIADMNPID